MGVGGAGGTPAPSAPTSLVAVIGQTAAAPSVALAWDNVAAVTWNVEKSTNNGSSYSSLATGVATNSYNDTTFIADQVGASQLRYRVKAVNAGGTSAAANQAVATLLTIAGAGTYAFPVGATGRQSVCVGTGESGAGGTGGGGGAMSIKALANTELTYNTYVSPVGDLTSCVLSDGDFVPVCEALDGGATGVGIGGPAAGSTGDTKHSGGNGEAGGFESAGGGAGGKTGDGQNGLAGTGGTAGSGGLLGGDGGNTGVAGHNYGGGGSDGQAGAGGCIALTCVVA